MKKNTTKNFIRKAKKIHGSKYDYSLVDYINSKIKIKIICPVHGIFEQTSISHLKGQGCLECGGKKRGTTIGFVNKANIIHSNKYDYSLVNYINSRTKVKIICSIHGIFEQTPEIHLRGCGCPKCKKKEKSTTIGFTNKANIIHDNKYDYSLVDYQNKRTKVKIICPTHGIFEQIPNDHLKGTGCSKCSGLNKPTTEEFVNKATIVHSSKYDYSLVDYINNRTKIKIICRKHGVFEQTPASHLKGCGCSKCCGLNKLTTEEFINKASLIHKNKYDYSLVNYVNSHSKTKIICSIHGIFEQISADHLNGIGCPKCCSSKGEVQVKNYLDEKKINYIQQHKFKDCKLKRPLPFDFYLPELNICIEYDGHQHFKPVKYFGGEEMFFLVKKKDEIKTEYCKTNNIQLIRIPYLSFKKINLILLNHLKKRNLL